MRSLPALLTRTALALLFLPSAARSAEPQMPVPESKVDEALAQCQAIEDVLEWRLARCGTAFQLDDPTLEPFRITREPRIESMPDIPHWVPMIQDLVARSNIAERADWILGARKRSWGDQGSGGEFATLLWFNEVVAHAEYIEAFEEAGYMISDWMSVPSRQAHALSSGGRKQVHYLVASDPDRCRSVHVTFTGYPDSADAPFPAKYEGPVTEIQVAFRAPAGR